MYQRQSDNPSVQLYSHIRFDNMIIIVEINLMYVGRKLCYLSIPLGYVYYLINSIM